MSETPEIQDIGCEPTEAARKARLHCGCVAGGPHTTDCPTVLGDIARREQRWKDPDWICPRCQGVNSAVRQACRLCGFDPALVIEMESGATADLIAVVASDSLARVLSEVEERRKEQDAKHGGPKHDDLHIPMDWVLYVEKFLKRADECAVWPVDQDGFENNLLDIAALAVAAIQSSRRKRNAV